MTTKYAKSFDVTVAINEGTGERRVAITFETVEDNDLEYIVLLDPKDVVNLMTEVSKVFALIGQGVASEPSTSQGS